MESKYKKDDIVYWTRDRSKYKIKEFQRTNGIGGSYWLKNMEEGGMDSVACAIDLCHIGELLDEEKIIFKILECMFPDYDWLYFKEEYIKNDYKFGLNTDNSEYGTLDFMGVMFNIIDQKYQRLVNESYGFDAILVSNICDSKFVALYTHFSFSLWFSNGAIYHFRIQY